MKKLLSLTLVSVILFFSGCCSVKNSYYTDENATSVSTEFNEEHYIWENWFNSDVRVK